MRKSKWLLILALLATAARLGAEEIQLKDGTKITGKLTGVSSDTLQIRTPYGDINVPRSEIITINFPENAPKSAASEGGPLPPVDEELKGETYINRTAGFQLKVPSGWKLAPDLRKSKDVVAALDSSDDTLFFMVTPEKFSGTLKTYKALAETQYQKNFSSYVEDLETDAELDGKKGIKLTWHGTSKANNTDVKFLVYILPYEGRMVRLSFFTLPLLFADSTPIFEKIAASYHSVGKPAEDATAAH